MRSILLTTLLAMGSVALPICAQEAGSAAVDSSRVMGKAPDFGMNDHMGDWFELYRRTDLKGVVLFYTANGCPVARHAVPRLKELRQKFAKEGVLFMMVNATDGGDRRGIQKEAFEFHINFPILMDETQMFTKGLGVDRTGEAILIRGGDWRILYRGAIDDGVGQGAQKPATEAYLEDAIGAMLAGREVANPQTRVAGCKIPFEETPANISFAKDIAPILQNRCVSCHREGSIGPFAMDSLSAVRKMRSMIEEVVLNRSMPPWHADPHVGKFTNENRLAKGETRLLLQWIRDGAKPDESGEDPLAAALPPIEDWPLGKPDLVLQIPQEVKVPATGVMDYIYQTAEVPIDRDMWVRGAVVKPGNRKVVHHVIAYMDYPERYKYLSKDRVFFVGWAPGSPEQFTPDGTAKFLPKGSVFRYELHYTTMGKEQTDRSEIGLYFAEDRPKHFLETRGIYNYQFTIPPGERDYRVNATMGFPKETVLYDLSPHMHLRGSWFKFEALYPNGKRELLLSVPKYDFNWQNNYRLASPKVMPAGTWLLCTGGFDNSPQNPHNPNPDAHISFGEQSFDEMFIGFIGVAETQFPRVEPLAKK